MLLYVSTFTLNIIIVITIKLLLVQFQLINNETGFCKILTVTPSDSCEEGTTSFGKQLDSRVTYFLLQFMTKNPFV